MASHVVNEAQGSLYLLLPVVSLLGVSMQKALPGLDRKYQFH
jgi:hypothetical protein